MAVNNQIKQAEGTDVIIEIKRYLNGAPITAQALSQLSVSTPELESAMKNAGYRVALQAGKFSDEAVLEKRSRERQSRMIGEQYKRQRGMPHGEIQEVQHKNLNDAVAELKLDG